MRRRSLVGGAVVLGVSGLPWPPPSRAQGPGASRGLPALADPRALSGDEFHALSALLCGREDLNRGVARRIHQLLADEPWGPEHLRAVYLRLRELAGDGSGARSRALADPSRFAPSERWFIGHLLVTWYTGVYYHESGNVGITLTGSLMYGAVSAWRTPPTVCGGAPGYWTKAPPAAEGA